MKTPDEIKKGLAICVTPFFCNEDCPYYDDCDDGKYSFAADALAYIQQLEQENTNLKEMLRNADRHIKGLEAERDAAVADLRKGASCEMCAHGHECRYPDDYKACKMRGSRKWEWRGVCEENSGKEAEQHD